MLLVSGGQVAKDAADSYSGLHPAWRKSPFMNIVGRGWAPGSSEEAKAVIRSDITNVKGAAMKALAPNTGGYMNEGDRLDPEWQKIFFGPNYAAHAATKRKYDPLSLFTAQPASAVKTGWSFRMHPYAAHRSVCSIEREGERS